MPSACTVIINPTAGGYSERAVAEITAAQRGYGLSPEVLLTRSAGDAALFAGEVCEREPEPFIVAGGGDGTVNEVLNGLLPGAATLALLPLGTANALAKELGIRSIGDALGRIARRSTRPLSVGLLETGEERRYFALVTGIGFDGAVVEGVRLGEKRWLRQTAYFLSAVRCLGRWERETVTLVVDGERRECHSVMVCNASRYAGDFVMAREADIFSPGFQVVCIRESTRRGYLRLALRLFTGRGVTGSGVEVFPARELSFAGGKAIQADGDCFGRAPGRIRTVEGFARLVV